MTGRQRVRWFALSLFTVFVATAQPALGAANAKEQAVKLYEEGVKAAKAGEWEKACGALGEAFAQRPHSQIAVNLGRAEFMAGRPREAAVHLSFFLREAKKISDDDRRSAEQMLAKAKAKIGALALEVSPRGAEVFVDGLKVGMAPLGEPVFVMPGRRRIEARKAGLVAASREIEARAGTSSLVKLSLDATPQEAPARVAKGESARARIEPEPSTEGSSRTVLLTLGTAAGASLVAGTFFTGLSLADEKHANQLLNELPKTGSRCQGAESTCDEIDAARKSHDTLGNLALGAFIGAGACAAGMVAYGLLSPRKERPKKELKVLPSIGVRQVGVSITGTF